MTMAAIIAIIKNGLVVFGSSGRLGLTGTKGSFGSSGFSNNIFLMTSE